MARRLFTLAAALSLLLCVGVAVLWVRSYWWIEVGSGGVGRQSFTLYSSCGQLLALQRYVCR